MTTLQLIDVEAERPEVQELILSQEEEDNTTSSWSAQWRSIKIQQQTLKIEILLASGG